MTPRLACVSLLLLSHILTGSRTSGQALWTIGEPLLTVESEGAEAAFVLDSLLFVAMRGSAQIRAFEIPSGRLRAAVGRPGQGPGEFTLLRWLDSCDGRVVHAWDPVTGMISVFSPSLELISTLRLPPRYVLTPGDALTEVRVPRGVTCGPDGELLVTYVPARVPSSEGPYTPLMELVAIPLMGGPARSVGQFRASERYRFTRSDGPRPLGKVTIVAGLPDGVLVGAGDAWRLARYHADGTFLEYIRLAVGGASVITRADLERLWDAELDATRANGGDVAARRRALRNIEYPPSFPPYQSIIVSSGEVWIKHYPRPGDQGEMWTVSTLNSMEPATVRLPYGFRALSFDDRTVIGVQRVELERAQVQLRPILGESPY